MKKQGEELIFISRIQRDGKGVYLIEDLDSVEHCQSETFRLIPLSMTEKTFIASNFNVYVVKLKP